MYCCYLFCFIKFLFFTVRLLYVIVRMNMYVMFLLRQRRLNKLILYAYTHAAHIISNCIESRHRKINHVLIHLYTITTTHVYPTMFTDWVSRKHQAVT